MKKHLHQNLEYQKRNFQTNISLKSYENTQHTKNSTFIIC